MVYKDILFAVEPYPEVALESAWPTVTALAGLLGGELTALAFELHIRAPNSRLANMLIGLDQLAKDEEARSAVAAREVLQRFTEAAAGAGLAVKSLLEQTSTHERGDRTAQLVRTRDLCLLTVGPTIAGDTVTAESVLFGSGRPIIAIPEQGSPVGQALGRVAIAWDGTRHAARTVSDAMPLLRAAAEVRVVTVIDEKASAGPGAAADLVRHLSCHGLSAKVDEVALQGDSIGKTLRAYVARQNTELMVMGAFGHSRMREFILGGATRSMLDDPPIPLFMAH
ncbi:MAG: universal stress protein [Caulobacter sp.]|nr:universal stress protein [Caulobacter sp.]